MKFNKEWDGFVSPIPWNSTDTDEQIMEAVKQHGASLTAAGSVPPGAAAVWLGLDVLRNLLK